MGHNRTLRLIHKMAANTAGIQTLLDAEKEAAKIVQKARDYRTQRVKDAGGEAAKEIEAYKAKVEREFQAIEQEHSGEVPINRNSHHLLTLIFMVTIQSPFVIVFALNGEAVEGFAVVADPAGP